MKRITIHLNSNETPQLPQRQDNPAAALFDTGSEISEWFVYHVTSSDSVKFLFNSYDYKEPKDPAIQVIKDLEIEIYTNDPTHERFFNFCLTDALDNIVNIQNVHIKIHRSESDKTPANVNLVDRYGVFAGDYAQDTDIKYCSLIVGDISCSADHLARGCGGIMGYGAGHKGSSSIDNTYVKCGKLGKHVSGMMGPATGLSSPSGFPGKASITNSYVLCTEIENGAAGMMGTYPGQAGLATIDTSYVICDNIADDGYEMMGLLARSCTATIDGVPYDSVAQYQQQLARANKLDLNVELATAITERDQLTEENQTLTSDKSRLELDMHQLTEENDTLSENNTTLQVDKYRLTEENDTLTNAKTTLETEKVQLTEENQTLTSDKTRLETNLNDLRYADSVGGWQIYVSNGDLVQHSFKLKNVDGKCTYEKATRTTDDMYHVYMGKK